MEYQSILNSHDTSENISDKNKINYINILRNLYILGFSGIIIYYLISINSGLYLINYKIDSFTNIGSCLFKDICYTSELGKKLCGNCYSNMNISYF